MLRRHNLPQSLHIKLKIRNSIQQRHLQRSNSRRRYRLQQTRMYSPKHLPKKKFQKRHHKKLKINVQKMPILGHKYQKILLPQFMEKSESNQRKKRRNRRIRKKDGRRKRGKR